ncbi:MAG: DUF1553 domain-containing protein [Verrucomicrobiota bacterium]
MDPDRLAVLMTRLDAGQATDADLVELEELLASDYEARERFLDHAQIEGLLYGIGNEAEARVDNVVTLPTAAEIARKNRKWKGALVLGGAAAVLVAMLVMINRSDRDQPVSVVVVSEGVSSAETELTAEERYDLSRMNELGGATQAHPETATNTELVVDGGAIEFNRDIRPILSDNCFFCHGPDEADRKAGLRLDMEADALADLGGYAAIAKGDSEASELVARIFDDDPHSIMPPPESSRRLTEAQKDLLRRWIDQGAEWQQHWAFEDPVERELPVAGADWPVNGIDHFVLKKMGEIGLSPSPDASKETLLRRVSLDLTGLPPTVAELNAFTADESPDAFEKLVDRLLDSVTHAERMAWNWMEAARYADTDGYQNDGPRDMWRWRDWVIEAYNQNLPFDQFTIEQLAGDLLAEPTQQQQIATGFNRNHRYNSESGLVLEEFLLENAVDRVDTTMTVFMGLTMSCARCHDHKYDPLTHRDYHAMLSFFDNITESGRAIKFGNSEPWIKAPTPTQEAELAEIDYRIAAAQKEMAAIEENLARRQARWEASSPNFDQPLLPQGLTKHYGVRSDLHADGKKAASLEETIDGLICNGRFSIAFDMTPGQVDRGVVLSNEIAATTRQGIFVNFRKGHLRFAIVSRWIAGVAMLETLETFDVDQTYHIALTNDGTQRARGMEIWVDGKKAETRTLYNTNSNTGSRNSRGVMMVGGSKHQPAWKGTLSDLRFYTDRTLEEGEIKLLAEPSSLSEIAEMKPSLRSVDQETKLRSYFLDHVAPAKDRDLHQTLQQLWAERTTFYDSLPTTMIMEEAPEPKDTYLRVRGEYHNKGEVVSSGIPEVFGKLEMENPTRLDLAHWIVGEDNPLAARVAVNRHWQMLFGRGLVKTTEDFGTQGSLPSHPELLDWLAVKFVESGWDTRALLKMMVMSRTYRQSSVIRKRDLEIDPENVFLTRASRLKLPGNILRDKALAASGLLVPFVGGPSVKPYQPAGMWREASNFTYKQDKGDRLYRRSLYTYWKRTLAPPTMAVLDTADREWCSVKPKRTNTPLQALAMMNETGFFEAARKLGERMLREGGETAEEQLRFAFHKVLTRPPASEELALLENSYQRYLSAYGDDPGLAKSILEVGESKTDTSVNRVELAAATAVANVLFNLEEASVRE